MSGILDFWYPVFVQFVVVMLDYVCFFGLGILGFWYFGVLDPLKNAGDMATQLIRRPFTKFQNWRGQNANEMRINQLDKTHTNDQHRV